MYGSVYFLRESRVARSLKYTASAQRSAQGARHTFWRQMKKKLFSGKILVFAACGVLVIVWERVKATELGYHVEETRKSIEDLQSQLASLEKNLEIASSPSNLAQAAQDKLGMIPAPLESLRFMDAGSAQDIASSDSFSLRLWKKLRSWYHSTS